MKNATHIAATLALAGTLLVRPASAGVDPADAAEILDNLLRLPQPAYVTADGQGQDELKSYQGWSALYGRYFQRASADEVTPTDLKVFLLLGKIAGESTDAAMMQSFTVDLMAVYEKHRQPMLGVLKELSFLIPSTCHYLGRYFGFEDKHVDDKPAFLQANRSVMEKALPGANAAACLRRISGS